MRQDNHCRRGDVPTSTAQAIYHSAESILLKAQAPGEQLVPAGARSDLDQISYPHHSYAASADEEHREGHTCRTGRLRMFLARVAYDSVDSVSSRAEAAGEQQATMRARAEPPRLSMSSFVSLESL